MKIFHLQLIVGINIVKAVGLIIIDTVFLTNLGTAQDMWQVKDFSS